MFTFSCFITGSFNFGLHRTVTMYFVPTGSVNTAWSQQLRAVRAASPQLLRTDR